MNDYFFRYDGETCTLADDFKTPDCIDWNKSLRSAGYERIGSFGSEFSPSQVEVRKLTEDNGHSSDLWLIEVLLFGVGFVGVFCTSSWMALRFLRDWVIPFLSMEMNETATHLMNRADDILFDDSVGLPCARRHGARERIRRMEMRERKTTKTPEVEL